VAGATRLTHADRSYERSHGLPGPCRRDGAAPARPAVLEFHVWLSTIDMLGSPDRLVIDLDPPDGIRIGELRDAVRRTRGQVANAGLVPFIQTTGGRGFHVTAPLDATANSLR